MLISTFSCEIYVPNKSILAPSAFCTVRNDAPNYVSSPSRPHQPRHIPRSGSRSVGSFCNPNGFWATLHHPHSNALRSPHHRAHYLHILFIRQRTRIKSPSGELGLEHYITGPHEQGRHGIGQKTVSSQYVLSFTDSETLSLARI